tara:strand:- start:4355 stop:5509 length:1155 start_codon:yes stop_codon:yes gene_type:complete
MIFSNKYIEYSSKSKTELYATLILFKILSNKKIVFLGKSILNFALQIHLPILGLIKQTVFKQFCGGENISESRKKIEELGQYNIQTILDYSIEGKNDENSFQNTYHEILKNLEEAYNNPLIPFCVFKITGIARFDLLEKFSTNDKLSLLEKKEIEAVNMRLHNICKKATQKKIPVLIDAEESWIQHGIDELVENLMKEYNKKEVIVYNTIQLYRSDKLAYIKEQHEKAKVGHFKLGFKLVRGAYMEKERVRSEQKKYPCPIHNNKIDSDKDYDHASKYCIDNIIDMGLCFGTHNEKSTQMIIQLMGKKGINNNDTRIYFSQLLGMSDNISFYLGKFKYNVAKYVPYGPVKEVLPYLIRRAEENSSISGQTNREIVRIQELIENY